MRKGDFFHVYSLLRVSACPKEFSGCDVLYLSGILIE